MDRILRATPGTVSRTFYEDGVAIDPGAVTVTITASDGTVIVNAAAASGSGAAARTYNVTATDTALLDTWTVAWASSTKGTLVSDVEIVGGFLFSLADARAVKPLDDTVAYSTTDLIDMRTTVEQAIEQACGCAFVPRFAVDTLSGDGTSSLLLSNPVPTAIRSVTVAGTLLDVTALASVTLTPGGSIYYTGGSFTPGTSNVLIGYEHGYGNPPAEISRAALMLAKMWLVGRRNPVDDRAITFNVTDGGTYSLAVPGRNGSHFGHPDIDAAIDRYSFLIGVA